MLPIHYAALGVASLPIHFQSCRPSNKAPSQPPKAEKMFFRRIKQVPFQLKPKEFLDEKESNLPLHILTELGKEWITSRHFHPGDYFFCPPYDEEGTWHLYVCGRLGELHEFNLCPTKQGEEFNYQATSHLPGFKEHQGTCSNRFRDLNSIVETICGTKLICPQKYISSSPKKSTAIAAEEKRKIQQSLCSDLDLLKKELKQKLEDQNSGQYFNSTDSLHQLLSEFQQKASKLIAIKGRKLTYRNRLSLLSKACMIFINITNNHFQLLIRHNRFQNNQKIDDLQKVLLNALLQIQDDIHTTFKDTEDSANKRYLTDLTSQLHTLLKKVVDCRKRFELDKRKVIKDPLFLRRISVCLKIDAAMGERTAATNRELINVEGYDEVKNKFSYRGVVYSPLSGENVRISQFPVASCGATNREIILLNPENSPLLDKHYRRLLINLFQFNNHSNKKFPLSLKDLLTITKKYIRQEMFNGLKGKIQGDNVDKFVADWKKFHPDQCVNKFAHSINANIPIPVIPIDEFIESDGCCRHHSLLEAYLVDRLSFEYQGWLVPRCVVQIIRGKMPSGSGHSWTVVTTENGEQYLVDTAKNYMRNINKKENLPGLEKMYGKNIVEDMLRRTAFTKFVLKDNDQIHK